VQIHPQQKLAASAPYGAGAHFLVHDCAQRRKVLARYLIGGTADYAPRSISSVAS